MAAKVVWAANKVAPPASGSLAMSENGVTRRRRVARHPTPQHRSTWASRPSAASRRYNMITQVVATCVAFLGEGQRFGGQNLLSVISWRFVTLAEADDPWTKAHVISSPRTLAP